MYQEILLNIVKRGAWLSAKIAQMNALLAQAGTQICIPASLFSTVWRYNHLELCAQTQHIRELD